jgi:hypothetical protein
MAQRHRFNHKKQRPHARSNSTVAPREVRVRAENKPPVQYGKAFVLLEDPDKNTFEYSQGTWIPYAMSIAECRLDCQVKELPQKVNGKTRYEIRSPMAE